MGSSVGDALLDQLGELGVRVCFGVPGVHNLPFWNGAGSGRRPRIVGVRHEQAAGYAADGAARASGGLGVALTTTGPGFANALAAFGEAYASFSPVVLISSETPLASRRRSGHDDGLLHGMRSQVDVITHGFGARAISARSGHEVLTALPELAAHALTTGRPVYLGVPADILAADRSSADVPAAAGPLPAAPAPGTPDADRLTASAAVDATAVAALANALQGRRVALWLGARAVPAEDAVRRLAAQLGALVVPTYQARGMLADHVGTVVAPPHEPRVAEAIAACDVLLVIGDDLHGMTTRNWRMPVPASIVAITDDPHASLGDYALAARLVGDVGTLVDAVATALDHTSPPHPVPDGAALTTAVLDDVRDDERTASAADLVRTVEEGWPDAGALVLDMCVAGYWLGGYARQPRPRRLQYPVGWGTLGYALPAAIGPAALGIPTLAVVGDGGAAMGLGELATYAQEHLPLALLVVTDGGYGMLRYDQTVAGDPHRGVDLVEPRWEDLGAAYGLKVVRTDDPGTGLARALTQAREGLTCGERWMVVLVQAFHPPRTTSPRWREV
jgi:thiamine pyrophosphate-dependent acetolactate synthase large subunit-like protein